MLRRCSWGGLLVWCLATNAQAQPAEGDTLPGVTDDPVDTPDAGDTPTEGGDVAPNEGAGTEPAPAEPTPTETPDDVASDPEPTEPTEPTEDGGDDGGAAAGGAAAGGAAAGGAAAGGAAGGSSGGAAAGGATGGASGGGAGAGTTGSTAGGGASGGGAGGGATGGGAGGGGGGGGAGGAAATPPPTQSPSSGSGSGGSSPTPSQPKPQPSSSSSSNKTKADEPDDDGKKRRRRSKKDDDESEEEEEDKEPIKHRGFIIDARVGAMGCTGRICNNHDARTGLRIDGLVGRNMLGFLDLALAGGWGRMGARVAPGTAGLSLYGLDFSALPEEAQLLPFDGFTVNDASLDTLQAGLDARVHVIPRGRFDPYVGIGLQYSRLRGIYDTPDGQTQMAFHGITFPLQAGFVVFLNKAIALGAQFDYLWTWYGGISVSGAVGEFAAPLPVLDEATAAAGVKLSSDLPNLWSGGLVLHIRLGK